MDLLFYFEKWNSVGSCAGITCCCKSLSRLCWMCETWRCGLLPPWLKVGFNHIQPLFLLVLLWIHGGYIVVQFSRFQVLFLGSQVWDNPCDGAWGLRQHGLAGREWKWSTDLHQGLVGIGTADSLSWFLKEAHQIQWRFNGDAMVSREVANFFALQTSLVELLGFLIDQGGNSFHPWNRSHNLLDVRSCPTIWWAGRLSMRTDGRWQGCHCSWMFFSLWFVNCYLKLTLLALWLLLSQWVWKRGKLYHHEARIMYNVHTHIYLFTCMSATIHRFCCWLLYISDPFCCYRGRMSWERSMLWVQTFWAYQPQWRGPRGWYVPWSKLWCIAHREWSSNLYTHCNNIEFMTINQISGFGHATYCLWSVKSDFL